MADNLTHGQPGGSLMTRQINASGQYGNSQFTVSSTALNAAYTTIQEAVTAASGVSGMIYIYPGTYTESIAWPANISVEASANGEGTFEVEIIGNQTFAGNGNLSLRNIRFRATAGDTWTQSAPAGSGVLEFQDCRIDSSAGKGVVTGTTGLNTSTLYLRSSEVGASLQAIDASGNSILDVNSTRLATTTDNINCIDMAGATSLSVSLSNLNTSGIGTGRCVSLNSATNSVDSTNTRYNAGNGATAAAFYFTIAGGSVRSAKDEMFVAGGTYWTASAGAFGTLSYASTIINTGTTALIDPQITSTHLDTLVPDKTGVVWSDQGASTTVGSNTGSVSTAAITLTLPASPSNGDTCEFILGAALNLNVTANAGHTIRMGNLVSAVAGTASTAVLGNSLILVYNSTLTSWLTKSAIGNWVI